MQLEFITTRLAKIVWVLGTSKKIKFVSSRNQSTVTMVIARLNIHRYPAIIGERQRHCSYL